MHIQRIIKFRKLLVIEQHAKYCKITKCLFLKIMKEISQNHTMPVEVGVKIKIGYVTPEEHFRVHVSRIYGGSYR